MRITDIPAWQMAEMVRSSQLSAAELVNAHVENVQRLNGKLNAFVDLRLDQALSEAEHFDATRDHQLPLAGVPISIKSCIDVGGMHCEAGSKLRAGNIPQHDAVLVERLKRAGAIVLGVTNTPEFLMAYETDNLLYGRTANPWNLDYSPGGSSGGESAAIAGCMSAAGIGSDGGGSIRVPAHMTGICGLKPTPGVVPSSGHFPVGVGPFALTGVVGPMARTVRDLRIILQVISGADPADPMAAPFALPDPPEQEVRQLTIGWLDDDGLHPVTSETRKAVEDAVRGLKKEGFTVEPFRPDHLERARELWYIIFCRFTKLAFDPLVSKREAEFSPMFHDFRLLQSHDEPLNANDVLFTQFERDIVREKIIRQMDSHPILLMPVCSGPAFRHGTMGWTRDNYSETFVDTMVYSQWFNLLGFPAAVVPVGQSPVGLPIGVQIVGRPYEDFAVLRVAECIERHFGWKKPPIA